MICARCNRNRGDSLRNDPKLCRAHLATFAAGDAGDDVRIDCWRIEMHTLAKRRGLTLQLEILDRMIVYERAPYVPHVVIVPIEEGRGPVAPMTAREQPDWRPPALFGYQLQVLAAVNGIKRVAQDMPINEKPPAEQAAELISAVNYLVEALAVKIVRGSYTWAS